MHNDPVSGQTWIGDVSGGAEEISLLTKGANFQWPYTNGGNLPKPSPLIGTESPPVLKIGPGKCVIRGYVYRDSEFPAL